MQVACPLHQKQLTAEACTVKLVGPSAERMSPKQMPQQVKCEYVDNKTRLEIRVTLHSFPHQMITAASGEEDIPVKSSECQLQVMFSLSGKQAPAGQGGSAGAGALSSQALHFLLASGAFSQLLLKDDSKTIFSSTPQKPLQVRVLGCACLSINICVPGWVGCAIQQSACY